MFVENNEDYSELIGSVGENETYIKTVDLSEGLDRSFAARADLYDLPEAVKSGEITLDDLLAETGFDLKLSEEDRFQKLRQFRRLVNWDFWLLGRVTTKFQMNFSTHFIWSDIDLDPLIWFNMVVGAFQEAR